MRRPRILVLVPMLAALALGVSAAPAGATSWGTAPRVKARTVPAPELVAVRVGRHDSFDRVVFELRGTLPGYTVRYVPTVVEDASGRPVPLAGGAFVAVVLTPANAHDVGTGTPTWTGPERVTPGFPAVRQVAFAGDFEAHVTFGLGIGQRAGFRVLELHNPSRIVIDVAHPAQAATGAVSSQGGSGAGTTHAAGGALPFTGLPLLSLLGAGVGLIGVGLALLARQWRRRGLTTA